MNILFFGLLLSLVSFESDTQEEEQLSTPEVFTHQTLTNDSIRVKDLLGQSFEEDPNYTYYKTFRDSTYWIQTPVVNDSDEQNMFYFVFENAYLLSGDLWVMRADRIDTLHHHTYTDPLSTPRLSNYPTWQFQLEPKEKVTLLFRLIDRETRTRKGFEILNQQAFNAYLSRQFAGVISYGIFLLLVILMIVILAVINKEPKVLLYAGYLLFFIPDYASLRGFAQTYFWPDSLYLINNGRSLSHLLITLSGSFFFAYFYKKLQADKWITGYFRAFGFLLLPFLLVYLVKLFNDEYAFFYRYLWTFININLVVVFLLHLVLVARRKVPWYLALAFSLPIIGTQLRNNLYTGFQTAEWISWLHNQSYFISIILEISVISYFIISQFIIQYRNQLKQLEDVSAEVIRNKKEIIELKSKAVLPVDEIVSIKSDGHYLEFYLKSKPKPEVDRNRMKEILQILPSKFVQIHKSHIVNVDHIKAKYADKVILKDGKELPVSRTFRPQLDQIVNSS